MRCGSIFSPSVVLVVCLVLVSSNTVYTDQGLSREVGRTKRGDQTPELKLIRSTKTKRTFGPILENFRELGFNHKSGGDSDGYLVANEGYGGGGAGGGAGGYQ